MKIKFNSDDELHLNKTIEIPSMTIVVRDVFHKNDKYYPQIIEKILTFHNVIILIKSVVNNNKNEYYYNIFLEKGLYKGKSDTRYF